MNPMPVWNCEFKDGPEAKLDSLTVGAKFHLSCHGDIPVAWKEGGLMVTFAKPEDAFSLKILQIDTVKEQDVDLWVTAYKPGDHQPDYLRITQGELGFEVTKPKWSVKSVLKPGEPPKPYDSMGPWGLSVPLWFWLSLLAAVLFVSATVYRWLRRRQQRRKLVLEMDKFKTNVSPLHQYYRDSRQLRRRMHAARKKEDLIPLAGELNREFRLFVLRQFQIPTLDWTDKQIVRELRRRHRKTYFKSGESLRKTLRELSRLATQSQVEAKDLEQMHSMSLETAEKLEAHREGQS